MIPEAVARQAMHPFRELYVPPDIKLVDGQGFRIGISPWPMAQIAEPVGDGPEDVAAAVEEARKIVRAHDRTIVGWWIAPEHDHLASALAELGVVNEQTPGFEAVENGMALVQPPAGKPVAGVEVRLVETWEDYCAAGDVGRACFGTPELPEHERREQFARYRSPGNPGRSFCAEIDGRVVGGAYAALGDAGVNLFGGAVLPEARGRGVYRALTQARWDFAVERGTPALTVQAGKMSKPICEGLGFEFVGAARVFVDQLSS
ncbi:MAG TPA: GNAT family N-acetyltransferase [Gaiellaceae bacterium]|nr:GNAT family N-acetyltransferase [Gaiellaceae bacterium]